VGLDSMISSKNDAGFLHLGQMNSALSSPSWMYPQILQRYFFMVSCIMVRIIMIISNAQR
jgi:hypothetical protein